MYYIATIMKEVKSESLNLRTTKEVKDFLEKQSKTYDRSISYIVNDLIEYFIKNPPKSIPVDKEMTCPPKVVPVSKLE